MRLLLVAEGVPTRDAVRGDGSSMISFELIRRLPTDIEVTLVAFGSSTDPGGGVPPEIAGRCERVILIEPRAHRAALVRSIFSRLQVGAEERAVPRARTLVRALSRTRDVTLLHGPHVQFLARDVVGPLVIQSVDPWSMRSAMDARAGSPLTRAYRAMKVGRTLAFERDLPTRARLLTVGAADAERWSSTLGRPVRAIGNGVETAIRPPRGNRPPTVCFVGSLNYAPNVESARVLVEQVAPLIWSRSPSARFVIAGRQPVERVMALRGPRVEVLANVPDVTDVFHSADVAVFADRAGLGVRNSVREALAAGIPVVATDAAAREIEPGELLSLAQEPLAMAQRVLRLLADAEEGSAPLAPSAASAASERSWDAVAADYVDELRAALLTPGQGRP
jgi:glycosyltransferase involved in cell wall biosynthesis